jgi:hypothetical protein
MTIKRATIQPGPSLETSYEELAASTGVASICAKHMLPLLKMLSVVCADFQVWGLTSCTDLWLLASEEESSPWLVQVIADPCGEYRVRYKMKASDAPWPDAFVEAKAPDEAATCKLILIAMKNSGGWC